MVLVAVLSVSCRNALLLACMSSSHSLVFWHAGLMHLVGSVYWYCCSTSGATFNGEGRQKYMKNRQRWWKELALCSRRCFVQTDPQISRMNKVWKIEVVQRAEKLSGQSNVTVPLCFDRYGNAWRLLHVLGAKRSAREQLVFLPHALCVPRVSTASYEVCRPPPFLTRPHFRQVNVPLNSSGRTSVDLVTVPLTLTRRPMRLVLSWRTRSTSGRLKKLT